MLIEPLLQVVFVLWLLSLLLGVFMYMAAVGVFYVVDSIAPLVIEDVPEVPLV